MDQRYRPSSLLLQWHLSDACNLRCTHCYQESFEAQEPGLEHWLQLLDDYLDFLGGGGQAPRIPGHINVTGGEPFALRDFPALLDAFARHRQTLSFGILSNGTLIDRAVARQLRQWNPAFVQISLDGIPATHDRIRGEGAHAKALAGIRALCAEGVRVMISFTAQPDNYREFPAVAHLGHELGVHKVWSDRVIPPSGPGAAAMMLTPAQTEEYLLLMAEACAALPAKSKTQIPLHRALQFLEGGDSIYRCTAGESLITVMPDGTLYPCRRLPIPVGNVYQHQLHELYYGAPLQDIRTPRQYEGCEQCGFAQRCQGGLRCLSWAATGRLDQADPGCTLAQPGSAAKAWIPIKAERSRVD